MYLATSFLAGLAAAGLASRQATTPASSTTCNDKSYVYERLAGYGQIPGDSRDHFGDTIGGIGSAIVSRTITSAVAKTCLRDMLEMPEHIS